MPDARSAFERLTQHARLEPAITRSARRGMAWLAYRDGRVGDAVKEFKRALKGADAKHEAAAIRDIERGLRRARYLSGARDVTLKDLARAEQRSRVDLAMRLGGRRIRNRVRAFLAARQVTR